MVSTIRARAASSTSTNSSETERVSTAPGAGKRERERERIALEGVKRHHKDAKRLRVMHLPRDFRFETETLYRVDLRAKKLAARKPHRSRERAR
jgi:hypothetical protein